MKRGCGDFGVLSVEEDDEVSERGDAILLDVEEDEDEGEREREEEESGWGIRMTPDWFISDDCSFEEEEEVEELSVDEVLADEMDC